MIYTKSCAMGLLYPRSKLMALDKYCLGSYNNGWVNRVAPDEPCDYPIWEQSAEGNSGMISIPRIKVSRFPQQPDLNSYLGISSKHLPCFWCGSQVTP